MLSLDTGEPFGWKKSNLAKNKEIKELQLSAPLHVKREVQRAGFSIKHQEDISATP